MAAGTATGAGSKQANMTKGARRRRRLFLTLVGGFTLWAIVAMWDQTLAMNEKRAELRQLQQRLDQVKAESEAYQAEVTRLQDPEYIEQKVRKDYGMSRPGDKVFAEPAE